MTFHVHSDASAPGVYAPAPVPAVRRPALRALLACALVALVGVGVCVAAVLVPAPASALAPVVAVSVGAPLLAGHALAPALASWRSERAGRHSLHRLRAALDRLPTVEHPLEG